MNEERDDRVKWESHRSIQLVRVRDPRPLAVAPAAPMIHAYVHWNEGLQRTMPCLVTDCRQCRDGLANRPMSYFGGKLWKMNGGSFMWTESIFEVPMAAGVAIERFFGQIVQLKRDRKFGPVVIGHYENPATPPIPATIDVLGNLVKLWRLNDGEAVAMVVKQGCGVTTREVVDNHYPV